MEERKLTDKDVIKALENCSVGYGAGVVGNLYEETLNLIHRLQTENEEYKWKLENGELVSKEWHDEQVLHLQTENEELKKSKFGNWKVKFFKAQEEINEQKSEIERLREDNDKQKAVIERLKIDRENEKKWCKIKIKQVVEDTAEEALEQFICKIVNENIVGVNDDLYDELLLAKDELLKEKYGVE